MGVNLKVERGVCRVWSGETGGGRKNSGERESPQLGPCHSPARLAASAAAAAGALSKVT